MDPLAIAGLVSGAGSIASSLFGNDGAKDAAKAQKKALKYVQGQSRIARGDVAPYLGLGQTAVPALTDALGLGDSNAAISRFEGSPLYKLLFGDSLDDAREDVLSTASSRGMLNSGSTLRGLTDARAKTARGFFGDYLSGLGDAATRGQNAATTSANIATGTGSQLAGLQSGLGDIALSRGLGIGNTIANGTGDLAAILGMKSAQRGGSIYGGGGGSPDFSRLY
jgi:hypothetical protein